MDSRALRYFIEVVSHKSFTRAAAALNVTQPAISKMVRQLEEALGSPLLIRSGRTVELTEAGRVAYTKGMEILKGISALRAEVGALNGIAHGILRLGVPPFVGSAFFPKVVRAFQQRYPSIRVSVVEQGGKRILEQLKAGEVDVGVTLLPFDREIFEGEPFVEQTLFLVVPDNDEWAGRTHADLADLAAAPFVMPSEDYLTGDRFREACRAAGFVPREVGYSGQWDFLAGIVEAGVGIACIPEAGRALLTLYRVRMIPIRPTIGWGLAQVWRRGTGPSANVRAWIEVARETLGPD